MDFKFFLTKIQFLSTKKLGGLEAQFKLAPAMRQGYSTEKIKAYNPKKAAVLALFYPNKKTETTLLLTQRASYNGIHSAQISFPGGKTDILDKDLQTTALRETFEEVGVPANNIQIFKKMTEVYIPPSNFLVTPFIAYCIEHPHFKINHEVKKLIEVPLKELLDKNNITQINISTSYAKNINVPCFKFKNETVWGATAMMLSEIKEFLK